jgi:hypothetical protein
MTGYLAFSRQLKIKIISLKKMITFSDDKYLETLFSFVECFHRHDKCNVILYISQEEMAYQSNQRSTDQYLTIVVNVLSSISFCKK